MREFYQQLGDQRNPNFIFLNPNLVISKMCEVLKVKKTDLLSKEYPNLASIQAQCQHEIVQETKSFFLQNGIDIDKLASQSVHKIGSSRSLIVKNINPSKNPDQLRKQLSFYGNISRFLMPPNQAVALVRFQTEFEARNALKHLSNRKFNGKPLYLSWVPKNVWVQAESQQLISSQTYSNIDS